MKNLKGFEEEQLGNSLVYSYTASKSDKKVIAVRGDIDAVLTDEGTYEHRCGHNGHTAILLDLAAKISETDDKNVILIFQSAEETGAWEKHPDLHTKGYSFNVNNLKYISGLLFDLISEFYKE